MTSGSRQCLFCGMAKEKHPVVILPNTSCEDVTRMFYEFDRNYIKTVLSFEGLKEYLVCQEFHSYIQLELPI